METLQSGLAAWPAVHFAQFKVMVASILKTKFNKKTVRKFVPSHEQAAATGPER